MTQFHENEFGNDDSPLDKSGLHDIRNSPSMMTLVSSIFGAACPCALFFDAFVPRAAESCLVFSMISVAFFRPIYMPIYPRNM